MGLHLMNTKKSLFPQNKKNGLVPALFPRSIMSLLSLSFSSQKYLSLSAMPKMFPQTKETKSKKDLKF